MANRRLSSSLLRRLHAERGPIFPTLGHAICELHVRPVGLYWRQKIGQRRLGVFSFGPLDRRVCRPHLPLPLL